MTKEGESKYLRTRFGVYFAHPNSLLSRALADGDAELLDRIEQGLKRDRAQAQWEQQQEETDDE